MKIMILGIDGYLGWSLAQWLADRGHEVSGLDNFMRRSWVKKMGSVSAIPISNFGDRLHAFRDSFNYQPVIETASMEDYEHLCAFLAEVKPDAIVHLAECPSAPYSMKGVHEAAFVMRNNVIGTLYLLHAMRDYAPDAHLLKLGTMGEYGTPNADIPEGFFDLETMTKDGVYRTATLPFPRQAGSWYHWSKVHDSMNINFACDMWGLRSTDIMQGVVYGTWIPPMGIDPRLRTRLDFDEAFGTAINRFVCQAVVGHPLTVYGDIGGQTRGFLPLQDSMQCLTLALESPPDKGEYRVFNQFEETQSIIGLAWKVKDIADKMQMPVEIGHYEPPRKEAQEHYYNPDHQKLIDLGYVPSGIMDQVIMGMLSDLEPHADRIAEYIDVLIPEIRWDGTIRKSEHIG